MKFIYASALALSLFISSAHASVTPSVPFENLRVCIMNNDADYCRSLLTPASLSLFNRFVSYNLMPCLPTNLTVESEKKASGKTILTVSMPSSSNSRYIVRLVYAASKLDLPATLRNGFGETWENKIHLTEQLYLMMKQNMGEKLTCDTIASLVMPGKAASR